MWRMSARGPAEAEAGAGGEASAVARLEGVGMRNRCCATMLRLVLELIARLAGVQNRDEVVKALGKEHIALSDEERYISVVCTRRAGRTGSLRGITRARNASLVWASVPYAPWPS